MFSAKKEKKTSIKGIGENLLCRTTKFKNDSGEEFSKWQIKALGEIGEVFNGLTGKTKADFGSGKLYIQYKQIFDSSIIKIENCGSVLILESESQNIVRYGDIFFTISSETPDEIGMSSVLLAHTNEIYLNSFCFGYRPVSFEILNPLFASFLFRSTGIRNEIIKLAQGSTRYNMSKIGLMRLKVPLPCIEEQITIAEFLFSIHEKIQTEKKILQQYEKKKKYLLQNLFI